MKGFPSSLHILFRYPNDPVKGLIKSALAGGDSAARNTALALVYSSRSGPEGFAMPY